MDTQRLRTLAAYLQTRRRRFADRAALEAWQERRLRVVLTRARAAFAYHREALPAGPVTLSDAPILTKEVWLDRFADLNAAGLSLAQCLTVARAAEERRDFTATLHGLSVGLSSGTSGRQGVFLTSPGERARWAGAILARALPGGLRSTARVALVLRAGGPLYDAVGSRRIAFRHIDQLAPLPHQLEALTAYDPTILAGPPAALEQYARAAQDGRITLSPSVIYSVADVLDPDIEALIRATFGVPVLQIYQATEGFLGISCPAGVIHLNEDLLVVERDVIDPATGRFVPIVTDLWRTSQAVIRYRMGDVLVPRSLPCPCGSPMTAVERIEGREDDLISLPGLGGEQAVPVFADAVRAAILGVPGVRDFRATQVSDGAIELAVAPGELFAPAATTLAGWIGQAGATSPDIRSVPWPVEGPGVKVRRVRRERRA